VNGVCSYPAGEPRDATVSPVIPFSEYGAYAPVDDLADGALQPPRWCPQLERHPEHRRSVCPRPPSGGQCWHSSGRASSATTHSGVVRVHRAVTSPRPKGRNHCQKAPSRSASLKTASRGSPHRWDHIDHSFNCTLGHTLRQYWIWPPWQIRRCQGNHHHCFLLDKSGNGRV
jgi:hypothetical protein